MPEIFKALDGIPLQVDIQTEDKFTVEFYLKPGLENYEWLQQLLKFTRNLHAYVEGQKEKQEALAETADDAESGVQ